MDILSEQAKTLSTDVFTAERYSVIALYKTAYYSFSLPIRLALYLAGYGDDRIHERVEKILLEMGLLFQIQDDYLDCFGDPRITGKIGTDIEAGKCCWMVVTALKHCSKEQSEILRQNYGYDDPAKVAIVKKLYLEIGLKEIFHTYEDNACAKIKDMINSFQKDAGLNADVLTIFLQKIYRRNK